MASPAEPIEPVPPLPDELSEEELAANEEAWAEEILWIDAEVEAGRMPTYPWEEVRERVFGKKA